MDRREVAAIIGQYSREGYGAYTVPSGFLVDGVGFRTAREARRDTGINLNLGRKAEERLALNFDLR